ncbi:MAG: hypothetical protein WC205_08900 [Opitutaceae bacterium]|jgi:hypothetical protein
MLKRLNFILLTSVLGLTAFVMSGCGGDSGSATTGPAAGSSFAGASISFNPTINFTSGNNLTYLNTEVGSALPAAATATNGTYTYTPNANYSTGTLTLTVDGITPSIVLEISNFVQTSGNVTGFSIRYNGLTYSATVTGSLPAYQAPSGGGGLGAGETSATDIPASMRGTYQLTYFGEQGNPSAPAEGTTTTFTINARTLVFGGRTLSNPVFYQGNTLEWLFKDGGITYAASISASGGLNEINLYPPVGTSGFYGQYRTASPVTLTSGKPTSGTYTGKVESINPGTASAYPLGTTKTFVFGTSSVDFDGTTFNFVSANQYTVTYTATINTVLTTIDIGLSAAAGTDYISYISVYNSTDSYFFRIVP